MTDRARTAPGNALVTQAGSSTRRREQVAFAPGRVNLIGDHTDYNGGLALPMAVRMGTQVSFSPNVTGSLVITSDAEPEPAVVDLTQVRSSARSPIQLEPFWARYAAGVATTPVVAHLLRGGTGTVTSNLPRGAGLSSSASLEVALALALGGDALVESTSKMELARACQDAEHRATGVKSGLMDQIAILFAATGHATLIDFSKHPSPSLQQVSIPEELEVLVVASATSRRLAGSAYARRRAECMQAAEIVGSLGSASIDSLAAIMDPVLAARARHVVTECRRVRHFVQALEGGDFAAAGASMTASHQSLSHDFEVSTPELDSLVEDLVSDRRILGARLTGAGFGGCAVALCRAGTIQPGEHGKPSWVIRPAQGAQLHLVDGASREGRQP